MAGLIPGVENINWAPFLGQTVYWFGWFLMSIVILGAMYLAYTLSNYTIRAIIFPLYASGRDGIFSIGKPKQNSVRWIDKKMGWKALKPFFNKNKLIPFPAEFIYPGNRIFAFEIGNQWIPSKVDLSNLSKGGEGTFTPIPTHLRNWEIIVHKQIDAELASEDWWSKNKTMFIALICGVCCLILCGATIYFAYKFAAPNVQAMNGLTQAINNMINVGGASLPH